jgi:hypothetical protein
MNAIKEGKEPLREVAKKDKCYLAQYKQQSLQLVKAGLEVFD